MRILENVLYKRLASAKRVALVGDVVCLQRVCADMKRDGVSVPVVAMFTDGEAEVAATADMSRYGLQETVDRLFAQPVDMVFATMHTLNEEQAAQLVNYCADSATALVVVPAHVQLLGKSVQLLSCAGSTVLSPSAMAFDAWHSRMCKRVADVVLSLLLLATAFPLIALFVAFFVKKDKAGSVLVPVKRTNQYGRTYNSWHFRTVHQLPDARFSMGDFLHRTHLHEWPQLLNVLCGQMSLVGPQLHELMLDDWDAAALACFMRRHRVKPGITGWARVQRSSNLMLEEKRQAEMAYVRRWSMWQDVRILWRTVLVLMLK